jgi:hypothetical protein
MRPSEVADAMARWSELPSVSALAHAGNGVLYVAADESGLTDALLQHIRALTAKYRVLSGVGWLRDALRRRAAQPRPLRRRTTPNATPQSRAG